MSVEIPDYPWWHDLMPWKRISRMVKSGRWALIRLLPGISKPLLFGAVLTLLTGLASAVLFTLASGALVGAIAARDRERIVQALIWVASLFLIQQIQGLIQAPIMETFQRRVNAHMQQMVLRSTLAPTGVAHLEDPELLNLVRDAQGVGTGQFTPGGAVRALGQSLGMRIGVFASAFLVGYFFNWWIAIGLVMIGFVIRARMMRDFLTTIRVATGQTQLLRRSDYYRDLVLNPEAAKETRVFGLGSWILGRFKDNWLGGMTVLWKERKEASVPMWWWAVPWGFAIFGATYAVGSAGLSGELNLTHLTIVLQSILGAGAIYLSDSDLSIEYGAAAIPAALELQKRVREPDLSFGGTADPAGMPTDGIRFESVGFHYPGQEREVYRELDLFIPAGKSLAIVGQNGAGKTTLVKLLSRLYEPTSGRIAVDGTDLREFDPRKWQRRVGAIFQDFVRYELPVTANIGFGAIERLDDLDGIKQAAERAGAEEIITGLGKQWDTILGREYTEGAELSGGQWQRVALARALFAVEAGAGILILDEPTANLDVRAEVEIFDRFLELTKGLTTILISHRFSTVRHADNICVLEHGKIIEQGSHAELMDIGGSYAQMFNLQASRFRVMAEEPEGD
ncbi:MAG TPA: ABC transporter ATP-binding protein [Actinomycetota bacterium]|nr:ABC transporter ATP-binding protein [Actinomycetota bacterium]